MQTACCSLWPVWWTWQAGALPAVGRHACWRGVTAKQSEQDPEDVFLYVLTNNGLHKEQLGVGEPDKLYYESDVAREASLVCPGKGGRGSPARLTCG